MRTVIVNKSMSPGLFKRLEDARRGGTRFDGCYITKYQEYKQSGATIGRFTLGDPGDDAPWFGS